MKIEVLERLGELLEEPAHLLVWKKLAGFEVVAVEGDGWQDAFPLPMAVQAAAAEAELILDIRTAVRLELVEMPGDFWEELEEVEFGANLRISWLGRSGAKYLEVYEAVQKGVSEVGLSLQEDELLKVARWIREKAIFDHRSGDIMMEIFTKLGR